PLPSQTSPVRRHLPSFPTRRSSDLGPRSIDYPFYSQVIDYAMADRIFEALLRLGGNLIIPASFVNILNPPEAELVRRAAARGLRSEEHTSELQSRENLVCRLLLEKK